MSRGALVAQHDVRKCPENRFLASLPEGLRMGVYGVRTDTITRKEQRWLRQFPAAMQPTGPPAARHIMQADLAWTVPIVSVMICLSTICSMVEIDMSQL